ncbi:MAG TPA: hypothetical protein VNZ26_01555, partial [Vicinamibacterales bacterium]|nr:hypothetical protein [Vicinamibacterales bacterium]
ESRRQRGGHANGSVASVDELLAYFRLRLAYETKRYAELTKEALDRLRAWREIFGNPLSESLFDRWQREGDDGVRSATAIASAPVCPAPRSRGQPVRTEGVQFETAVLPHAYTTFGPTRLGAVGPLHEPHAHMQRRRRNVCR